jgi:hypothetical protein
VNKQSEAIASHSLATNKAKQAQQNLTASQKQATAPSHFKQDQVKQLLP